MARRQKPTPPEASAPESSLPPIKQRVKLTPPQRAAQGKSARKRAPRRSHAAWQAAPDRLDPVSLLEEQSAQRDPDLVPIRYGRMLDSPFAFFRGGALIMAADLASTPVTGLTAQLCGDAHMMNFGLFASPERRLIFDMNDFDETLPGPWEWDVKRLAASFEVAGRERRFSADTTRAIVLTCVRSYRETMIEMAGMRAIDVWYQSYDTDVIRQVLPTFDSRTARRIERTLTAATGKDSLRALSRLTEMVDGTPRFRSDPPLLVPADELLVGEQRAAYKHSVEAALRSYRDSLSRERRHLYDFYRFKGMARKVVGVGSVGTRAWVMLFVGRHVDDPLFLQAKQALPSVLERFVGPSRYRSAGRRVVEGQRLMQAASDVLLGWYDVTGFDGNPYHFYMRQLWDGKGSFDADRMDASAWPGYARMCGWTLARAHARTGDRIAIAAYLGTGDVFDRAVADFAAVYADQNKRDYEALQAAAEAGRIRALKGI